MHSKTRARFIASVVAIVVAVIAAGIIFGARLNFLKKGPIAVSYSCGAGKTVSAVLYEGAAKPPAKPGMPPTPGGSALVTLGDGRVMTLPQTISADGVRYANADESFIFWTKGNGSLVMENNTQTYRGCVLDAKDPGGLPAVYSASDGGFSIRLPGFATRTSATGGYTVDESYAYQELGPDKGIGGVKFTIPAPIAAGTNLGTDSYVSVEGIPQVTECSAALFLGQSTNLHDVTEGDTTYSTASFVGAAAGNRYEETVYALPGTNPCVAVRYYVHYGVFENYPPGTVRKFDGRALLAQFDQIRRTLIVNQ